mmetsp:Transcript_13923/g.14449  ORF Transcript_13923/g.14449 Transcript_13923/m.14449 type:complete len:144 (-) Transcript_13923:13-444(-)
MTVINMFVLEKLFNIAGNFIVHISHSYRFFYSNIIHVVAIFINIILSFIIVIRLMNITKLCALFSWHYGKDGNKDSLDVLGTCSFQVVLYMIWIVLNVLTFVLKIIAINFAYRSHVLIKKLTKRKKRSKRVKTVKTEEENQQI